jgi:hypothetical protein
MSTVNSKTSSVWASSVWENIKIPSAVYLDNNSHIVDIPKTIELDKYKKKVEECVVCFWKGSLVFFGHNLVKCFISPETYLLTEPLELLNVYTLNNMVIGYSFFYTLTKFTSSAIYLQHISKLTQITYK